MIQITQHALFDYFKNVLTLIDLKRSSSLGSRLTKQRFFQTIQTLVCNVSFQGKISIFINADIY